MASAHGAHSRQVAGQDMTSSPVKRLKGSGSMMLCEMLQKCADRKTARQSAIRQARMEIWQQVDLEKILAIVTTELPCDLPPAGAAQSRVIPSA